jgi:hypothetical protein
MTFQVFLGFFASVSDACFKRFICLQTYVANALSGCFKSILGVAHIAMALVASGQRLATGLRLLHRAACLALSSPLLSIPSLLFPSLHLDAIV